MNFLANENFPLPSILLLRQGGHTVLSIAEQFPGIPDAEVLSKAKAGHLVILTFDKDYGELIFKSGEQDPPAVVFFRYKGKSPEDAGRLLLGLLDRELDIENKFTVVEGEDIRQRSY